MASVQNVKALIIALSFLLLTGCSIFTTRPTQEMADTAAAIKAAKQVEADVYAPDLYRRASELFFRAKKEYKFKNFSEAKALAERSRELAEKAEFEAIRGGASRSEETSDPYAEVPSQPVSAPPVTPKKPYDYPTPTPTPAEGSVGATTGNTQAPPTTPQATPTGSR